MKTSWHFLPMALSALLFSGGARADFITISGISLNPTATGNSGTDSPSITPTLGLHTTQNAFKGVVFADDTYDLTNGAFITSFSHSRTGGSTDLAESFGQIVFTIAPDAPGGILTYTLSGNYSVKDAGTAPGFDELNVNLLDTPPVGLPFNLFANDDTNGSLNASLNLFDTPFTGSLSGTLLAGHQYTLQYTAQTLGSGNVGDFGATASGNITLTFSDTSTAVPEPAVLPLSLFMLAGWTAFTSLHRKTRKVRSA